MTCMTPHAFGPTSTSQPGLGYIVISRPQTAEFRAFGIHFCISDLPGDLAESSQVCVWLGPDVAETFVYLIWPSKGIYSTGPPLSALNPSRIIELGSGGGALMNCEAPNVIAQELLHINQTPCFLFVRQQGDQYSMVNDEAQSLSFTVYALATIYGFMSYLEQQKQVPGDAVQSSALESWYSQTIATLSEGDQDKFLFDPTLLAAGILKDLGTRMKDVNDFDIVTDELLLIPMVFVRNWGKHLTDMLTNPGKELIIKNLIQS